jgi:hypothetical protein
VHEVEFADRQCGQCRGQEQQEAGSIRFLSYRKEPRASSRGAGRQPFRKTPGGRGRRSEVKSSRGEGGSFWPSNDGDPPSGRSPTEERRVVKEQRSHAAVRAAQAQVLSGGPREPRVNQR